MKWLMVVAVAATALWGGYWFIGSRGLEAAMTGWIEDRRVEGWQADYADLEVRGFPNRFDTTITDLALADPATGWAWRAPFFQILSLSYKPTHAILVWPDTQTLQTPRALITVDGGPLQGSVVLSPTPSLPLQRAALVFDSVGLRSDGGWTMQARQLRVGIRGETGPDTLQIGVQGIDIKLPALLARGETTPDTLAQLEIDSTVRFDAPWDRFALERARPQPVQIRLTRARAQWGALLVQLAGDLAVDPSGQARGDLVLKIDNWRDVLELAVETGVLPVQMLPTVTRAFQLAAGLSGRSDSLDLPLRLSGGRVWIGPVPVGQAPLFRLR